MASTLNTDSNASTKSLKVAVMGAGAVGCHYGGMLARAGHEVVLIARPAHVQGAQLVLFCVKSLDTESAGALMLPHLAPDALGIATPENRVLWALVKLSESKRT